MDKYIPIKIWLFTFVIVAFGLVALYSASYQNVRVPQTIFYDQLLVAAVGFFVMFIVQRIDFKRYHDIAYVLYGINVVLLLAVLFLGKDALGARRWIQFAGINFQPSELTKLAIIFFLARYYSHRRPMLSFNWSDKFYNFMRVFMFPFIMIAISMLLILKQPDLGTSLLMLGIFVVMTFIGGVSYKIFFGFLGALMCIAPFAWHFLKPYQKDRLLVFLNPNIDPLGAGYTIIQSKIAVGSGQIFGKGWLAGSQNQLNFLPERHTDFIFSVIGEEWGLLGGVFLLLMYFLLIISALDIVRQVKDRFGILLVVGIVTIITLQVIINVGMVVGLFPIVGLTLPLVSYGRSSYLIFAIMIGILLNLSRRRITF